MQSSDLINSDKLVHETENQCMCGQSLINFDRTLQFALLKCKLKCLCGKFYASLEILIGKLMSFGVAAEHVCDAHPVFMKVNLINLLARITNTTTTTGDGYSVKIVQSKSVTPHGIAFNSQIVADNLLAERQLSYKEREEKLYDANYFRR